MASARDRLARGESVPVHELLDELTADTPRTQVFLDWCYQRDLPPVVVERVAQLLRVCERSVPESLDQLVLGLECNQPGISNGMATYTGG